MKIINPEWQSPYIEKITCSAYFDPEMQEPIPLSLSKGRAIVVKAQRQRAAAMFDSFGRNGYLTSNGAPCQIPAFARCN